MDLAAKTCFVLDLDGTVYLGDNPIPGAVEFVRRSMKSRDFYFLSNNTSKNPEVYVRKLAAMGISTGGSGCSPGGAPGPAPEGPGTDPDLPGGQRALPHPPERAAPRSGTARAGCQAVVLAYDTTLTYEKLARSALLLQRPEVAFYATHPDLVCPSPEGPLPDVGSFLALYRTATGRTPDRIFGKPDPDMLAPLLDRYPKEAMVVAGDRLSTDKKLAEAAGIDFILVLSGEAKAQDLPGLERQPTLVLPDLGALL
jgi:ribonucleotide monophosphatase NagD (HAD superfamily)